MSKITNTRSKGIRRQLLVTVSTAALLASAYGAHATDNDGDRPSLWIELGGQFDRFSGVGDIFAPPFVGATDWKSEKLTSPGATQNMPIYSIGGEGTVSFQPEGSDWVFSAGISYGRAHGSRHPHDQQERKIAYYLCPNHCLGNDGYLTPISNYVDTRASSSESHTILDFQIGKDVGLGMFGKEGTSVLSAGVRVSRFSGAAIIDNYDEVNFEAYNNLPPPKYLPRNHHALYALTGHSERSFRGIGPSISWKASAPIAGTAQDAEITLDWGVNAAVLFGRQKAKVTHQTTGHYYVANYHNGFSTGTHLLYQNVAVPHSREHSVVAPNLGGFAGLSFRYSDAKISFGYRGDFFFDAIDGGLDTRKSTTRGFYGPFASISIGLGD